MNDLIIVGAGGHGKVVAELAQRQQLWDKISFIDDRFPELKTVFDLPVIGNLQFLNNIQVIFSDTMRSGYFI